MSTLLQQTKSELRRAGLFDTDADFDGAVAAGVTALMETFVAYGHSGGSAEATISAFTKLANHKPLTPLTGEDDEWIDRSDMGVEFWQNSRCPTVFKDKNGAWALNGSGGKSAVTFPYTVE